jgi:16S rRNA (guanine527-N7)-methyltransferase
MTSDDFQDQLARRAALAEIAVSMALAAQLEAYYRLLAHWNTRINLTALPLEPLTDQAIDRLIIEPIVAAGLLSMDQPYWFDFGSGSGSPAIPMKLARPGGRLTMVESRERKAAFLREAVRALDLKSVDVEAERIEVVAVDRRRASTADLITVRAVRIDPSLFGSIRALLRFGGQVLMFGANRASLTIPRGFEHTGELASAGLVILTRTGL